MIKSYDCSSIEEARERFPHLRDSMVTEVQTKDRSLILFHDVPFTGDELEVFKNFTVEEIERIFFNTKNTERLVSHYETKNSKLH